MRLIHLADLHLGFRAYSRVNDNGVNRREADVFKAFREALDRIVELQPDLVLLAGDIFHVPRPGNLAICQTQRELMRFRSRCAAPIVAIAGNHEAIKTTDNRCILDLLSLIPDVTVVTTKPEAVVIDKIRIFCLPHSALETIEQVVVNPDSSFDYNLLMLHGTVDSDRINDYGGYDIPAKILQLPWDYVACGHYHGFTHLGRNAYYAGAIERTSNDIWQEAEEFKGFIEFDLINHQVKFHALSSPRPTIDLPIIDAAHLGAEAVDQYLSDRVQQFGITDKLVRQRIINLPKSVQSQLNYRQIRNFQLEATHFLLDMRSPERSPISTEPMPKGCSLAERAAAFLQDYPLASGLQRQDFVERGLFYLQG